MTSRALGIYVHIPFCVGKCPYCSFNSRPTRPGDIEPYLVALREEIALRLAAGDAADTLYFGGGTPTILEPAQLAALIRDLAARLAVAEGAEITVEANPDTLAPDHLAQLREAGCNRLSIGVQSFDDAILITLGRNHNAARAVKAIEDARRAGWQNVSIDLIYGVPGQSVRQWVGTLERAVALGPEHISAYCLTVEDPSEFHCRQAAGEVIGVGEDAELEMHAAAREMLCAVGYEHYEISNFALPGRRCRHNEKYWRGEDYIGLGAGAHSSVGGVRWANAGTVEDYTDMLRRGAAPVAYAERLAARRGMDEGLTLALRTADGADLASLSARYGRDAWVQYRMIICELARAGLAVSEGSRLGLTEKGMALANEVAVRVMA